MEQFYCLSVVMNVMAALILMYGIDFTRENAGNLPETVEKKSSRKSTRTTVKEKKELSIDSNLLNKKSFRLIVGIAVVVVGLMKVLSVYEGIPIIGDLLPAVAGLAGGASILLEYYVTSTSSDDFELADNVKAVFIDSRKYIGVLCLVAAVLHFVFPGALLL
ncbi:MAG: hypothetical protein J6Y60_05020 [Treponema sp.]|nr:hypothetical protein [Treponema sp.]